MCELMEQSFPRKRKKENTLQLHMSSSPQNIIRFTLLLESFEQFGFIIYQSVVLVSKQNCNSWVLCFILYYKIGYENRQSTNVFCITYFFAKHNGFIFFYDEAKKHKIFLFVSFFIWSNRKCLSRIFNVAILPESVIQYSTDTGTGTCMVKDNCENNTIFKKTTSFGNSVLVFSEF